MIIAEEFRKEGSASATRTVECDESGTERQKSTSDTAT